MTAPLAAYEATTWPDTRGFVLMQHGSYQFLCIDDQPLLRSGEILLYRGVQDTGTFHLLRRNDSSPDQRRLWRRFLDVQAHVLSDSVRSFNSIHDRTKRCETGHLRDQSWITDTVARELGIDIDTPRPTSELWTSVHQSYALCRWVAENKFGPNFVVLKCPLDNIRITTFFAGEHEARIIDPNQLEVIEAHGCRIVEAGAR